MTVLMSRMRLSRLRPLLGWKVALLTSELVLVFWYWSSGLTKYSQLNTTPAYQCLPGFLRTTQYRNPSDNMDTPFQIAHHTDLSAFEWFSQHPENLQAAVTNMMSQRTGQKPWIADPDLFPVDNFDVQSDAGDDSVLMIDVSGSSGHQSITLRESHPDLRGRVRSQDPAETLALADRSKLRHLNIESQEHDFFTPQPVKGAKVYSLRNILRDWPDAACVTILKDVRAAMSSDSVVIVDEMVMRETESSWKQVNYDITMMACMAGMERSKEQWRVLFSAAELKLRNVIEYDHETGDSVIIAFLL